MADPLTQVLGSNKLMGVYSKLQLNMIDSLEKEVREKCMRGVSWPVGTYHGRAWVLAHSAAAPALA